MIVLLPLPQKSLAVRMVSVKLSMILPVSYKCAVAAFTGQYSSLMLLPPLNYTVFHKECISRWLLVRDCCPICRRSYFPEDETASPDDADLESGIAND